MNKTRVISKVSSIKREKYETVVLFSDILLWCNPTILYKCSHVGLTHFREETMVSKLPMWLLIINVESAVKTMV